MEGTLMLFYSRIRALFNTGASNYFIAVRMMNHLGLVPRELETVLNAVSPLSWAEYVRIVPWKVGTFQQI